MISDDGPATWTLENQRKVFKVLKQGKCENEHLKDSNFVFNNVDDKILKSRIALKIFER